MCDGGYKLAGSGGACDAGSTDLESSNCLSNPILDGNTQMLNENDDDDDDDDEDASTRRTEFYMESLVILSYLNSSLLLVIFDMLYLFTSHYYIFTNSNFNCFCSYHHQKLFFSSFILLAQNI